MKRVAVIGPAGAGKSTLSRELGKLLGLEVVHLDRYFWRPGWAHLPDEEWIAVQERLVRGEAWVIDGNYGRTMPLRFAAADTIIFLDFPRLFCLVRVCRRWLAYHGRTRPDLGPGCPETIDWEFIKWIWNFPRRSRPLVLARLAECGLEKRVVILRRPREVRRSLEEVRMRRLATEAQR